MAAPLSESELLALLDALADGAWHSGEALAAQAGITRAALAKRIDKLRDWQLDIEAEAGQGYRLAAPLQRLRVRPPQGVQARVVAVTDSTNTQLLAADAAHDPQALFAEFQTAGRGRRGRHWHSPFGANLYFSLAWTFAAWPPQVTALPLAVGLSCAAVLRAQGAATVGVKWPNDLYAEGRKLGGILIEQRGEAGGVCRAVIGIGLNVNMTPRQAVDIEQPWTSLQAVTGAAHDRGALASALLAALRDDLFYFERDGFAPFAARWRDFDLTAGRPVRVLAEPPYEGVARGIDAHGALLVEVDGAQRAVHSGEVSLRINRP
jgi:BirA family transcriptional regulator, biotin operon repressor / biotin---[acetyl-CoA-carboxylase] ligase